MPLQVPTSTHPICLPYRAHSVWYIILFASCVYLLHLFWPSQHFNARSLHFPFPRPYRFALREMAFPLLLPALVGRLRASLLSSLRGHWLYAKSERPRLAYYTCTTAAPLRGREMTTALAAATARPKSIKSRYEMPSPAAGRSGVLCVVVFPPFRRRRPEGGWGRGRKDHKCRGGKNGRGGWVGGGRNM